MHRRRIPEWRTRAACIGKTWMAQYGRTREARAVCESCPVLSECRSWGLTEEGRSVPGVVGGLTLIERAGVECRVCGTRALPRQVRGGICWGCYKANKARQKLGVVA